MVSTNDCVQRLRRFYQAKAGDYGIRRMGLFGSVARNEQKEGSDIDVVYEGEANLFLRCKMKEELEAMFGIPVDLVRMRPSLKGTAFDHRIQKDLIYV